MKRITPFFILLTLLAAPMAQAANFAYGTLNLPNNRDAVVRMRTMDSYSDYVCDLPTLNCTKTGTSTLSFVPVAFAGENVLMSPDGAAAVVRNGTNTFYRIHNDLPGAGVVLPLGVEAQRIFFLAGNTKILALASGRATLIDIASDSVVYSQPFLGGSFVTPSPDGRFLAYFSAATYDTPTRQYAVLSLKTGHVFVKKETSTYWDLMSEEAKLFDFSADGAIMYYLDDAGGAPTLYKTATASLANKKLTGTRLFSRDYTVAEFSIGPDGYLYFIANRDNVARWDFYRLNLKTLALTVLDRDVSYTNTIKTDGSRMYVNELTPWGSQPAGYDLASKRMVEFPIPHPTATIATGTPIAIGSASGVFIKPDGWTAKKSYPLVIWLHGGPYRHADLGANSLASYGMYDWMLENLRESGAVVLKLDYHGSYGYGTAFAESLRGTVGKSDVADVLNAVAAAKKKANIGNVYLMGVSYGGYLALRSLVEKPSLFTGVVSLNGVTDWSSLVGSYSGSIFRTQFNGSPGPKTAKLYAQASIANRIGNLGDQKILLVGSEADSEVPYSQTTNLDSLLLSAGKNVQFVHYAGEDHVFKYQTTAEDVCKQLFAFTGFAEAGKCSLAPAGPEQDQGLQEDGF